MKKITYIVAVLLLVLSFNFAYAQKTTAMEYAMATDNTPYNGVTNDTLYKCLIQNNNQTIKSTNGLGFITITVKSDSVDVTFVEMDQSMNTQISTIFIITKTTTVGIAMRLLLSEGPDPFYPSGRGVADKIKVLKTICGIK
jgi:hypothetical protein